MLLFTFCVEEKCITKNEKIQFVCLTRALQAIFYMMKVNLDES